MSVHNAMGLTVILILTLMVLAGCTREIVRYQQVPMHLPSPPTLPAIDRSELACLSHTTFKALDAREDLFREQRVELKSVICSTWPKEKPCPKWEEWE